MSWTYILHYAPDNASLIIRLALYELDLPFETRLVDRNQSAQRSPDYLKLNPAGRIPTLETPDGPISETAAALLWLGERHAHLVPAVDDPIRGAYLNGLFFISNTLHADVVMLFYTHRYATEEGIIATRSALRRRIVEHINILETEAFARLGNWIGGPRPSAIDLYIGAILRWVQIYPHTEPMKIEWSSIPQLRNMCETLELRPSVQRLCAVEGMTAAPFTKARLPNPIEGSAT